MERTRKPREEDIFFVTHDEAGIDTLVSRLVEERPVMVILEATGCFENELCGWGIGCSGLAEVAVVNSRQARDFPGLRAGSLGPAQ